MAESWAERRRADAAAKAELLDQRRRAEHDRARTLLREFAAVAAVHGPPAEALRVQDYGGRGTARTPLRGWHLRRDRTAAVSTDGDFYVLTADLSLLDRLRGTTLLPSDPPLVLGASGKDGDSIALETALERVLPGWRGR